MAAQKKAPLHVPIALGVTAGLYAVSLAGVTALQHQTDAVATAAQQPLADAIAGLGRDRTSLETDLRATVDSLNAAAGAYGTAAEHTAALEASVAALATQVQAATGAAARIPAQSASRLPSAPRTVTVVVTVPATQATTGASGKP
jgi:Na+/H+-translocating membrane pyrophosphatase